MDKTTETRETVDEAWEFYCNNVSPMMDDDDQPSPQFRWAFERARVVALEADKDAQIAMLEANLARVQKHLQYSVALEATGSTLFDAIDSHLPVEETGEYCACGATWGAAHLTAAILGDTSEFGVAPPEVRYAEPEDLYRHEQKQGVSYADAWRFFEKEGFDMSRVIGQHATEEPL